ncbi:hypothetical protein [Sinomonas atrocyanea]|jgi:hypothetical protein
MRAVMIALISYGTAINGLLLGLWLAAKWPAPRLKHFAMMGWVFLGLNVGMQILIA